jgi:hypothetical protein
MAVVASCLALSAAAQGGGAAPASANVWSFEVGLGAEYDSNVAIDELDLASGQSDYASVAEFKLGLKREVSERTDLSLRYSITHNNYLEFSQVDRLTQILGADISVDMGELTAGFSAYYIDSRLGGDRFLEYARLSPSLSGFLSKRWFARGAVVYSDRNVLENDLRSATTYGIESDLYYFKRGLRSYFNLGFRYNREDAEFDIFDFNGYALKLRYIRRWEMLGKTAKGELAMRYERRSFTADNSAIDERRQDRRLRWKADFSLPLSKPLTWNVYASYGDYDSNLQIADFDQLIIGTRFQLRW